ncbi:MAG: sulfurtransferase TusA family protein [Rhodomicrobium sp.]|nr:sulfurtransferase TusA family protein [Rhodomicrobium sp.]
MEANQTLDARGLNCPLPILRTKKTLNGMQTGEILKVVATDPGSLKDMVSFCTQTGNTLVTSQQSGQNFEFVIRKG